jgi:hypothetical protein
MVLRERVDCARQVLLQCACVQLLAPALLLLQDVHLEGDTDRAKVNGLAQEKNLLFLHLFAE